MKHRVLAMLISVCMLFQTVGTTTFAAGVSDNDMTVSDNEGDVSDNEGDVSDNEGDVSDNEGDVSDNEGDVSDNEGDVSDNEGDVSDNEGDVSDNEGTENEDTITYADSQFPDANFRNALKEEIGIGREELLTKEQLEAITSLEWTLDSDSEPAFLRPIESLIGIQYLVNLESVHITGHNISSADVLGEMSNLQTIDLSNNDIVSFPDLSKLAKLQKADFNGNLIDYTTISNGKLPVEFLNNNANWLKDTMNSQRTVLTYAIAPEYYAVNEKYPFIMETKGLKSGRDYTLTVQIDEQEKSVCKNSDGIYLIEDMEVTEGKYNATIALKDSYGKTYINLENEEIIFTAEKNMIPTKYVEDDEAMLNLSIYVAGNIDADTIQSLELLDANNRVVSSADISMLSLNTYTSEKRYGTTFSEEIDLSLNITEILATFRWSKYLTVGGYSVKLITSAETYEFKNAVQVSDGAFVYDLNTEYSDYFEENSLYDCSGDYIYVNLLGSNVDTTKVRPVFYHNETPISQFVNAAVTEMGYLYKLKKLQKSKYWTTDRAYSYRIEADSDYDFINMNEGDALYFEESGPVYFKNYNYKKNALEVYFGSKVADQTSVTISVYRDYGYTDLIATATGVVENGFVSVTLQDATGADYAIPYGEALRFKYEFSGAETFTYTESAYVNWYNWLPYETSENHTFCYWEEGLKELKLDYAVDKDMLAENEQVTATIMNYSTNEIVGEVASLTQEAETIEGKDYIRLRGMWTADTGLTTGIYIIRYKLGTTVFATVWLYIYDNNHFYMDDQEGKWISDDTIRIAFSSPQFRGEYLHKYNQSVTAAEALQLWNDNYKLSFYDTFGQEISGWELESATYDEHSFVLIVSGIARAYTGCYCKLEHKTYGLARTLTGTKSFYGQQIGFASEQYGYYSPNVGGYCSLHSDEAVGAYVGLDTTVDVILPITVSFRKPYDTEILKSFTIAERAADGYYGFTGQDLLGLSLNEAYTITTTTANGSVTMQTGYVATKARENIVVEATGVRLSKTSLELQMGDETALKATLTPANVTDTTITWSSSDSAVVSVDNGGRIAALDVGTAEITVTTHNGKIAVCSVTVKERVKEEELEVDIPKLSAITNIQTTLADVSLPDDRWKWVDETISLTSFTGMKTKEFAATYTKQAGAEPILVSVPVALTTINQVSVQVDNKALLVGQTTKASLVWNISGNNIDMTQFEKEAEWSFSKAEVAELVENATGFEIIALAKGKTKISVKLTIGEKVFSTQCSMTVAEGENAVITVNSVDKFSRDIYDINGYTADVSVKQGTINVTATNTTKLKVKSAAPAVVSVGTVSGTDGQFSIPLKVKSVGMAKITITANDPLKTEKVIYLYVTDDGINLSTTAITLNRLKLTGEIIYIYPNRGYALNGTAELIGQDADKFILTKETATNAYSIMPKDSTGKGNYTVNVKVGDKACENPMKIQVVEKEPKLTIKQPQKVNLFYNKESSNSQGVLIINSVETLEEVTLKDCQDFTLSGLYVNRIIPRTNNLSMQCDKEGTLVVKLTGYKPIEKKIKISVEDKAPRLSLSTQSAVLYPKAGIQSASITVVQKDSNSSLFLDTVEVSLKNATGYQVSKSGNTIKVTRADSNLTKTTKMKIVLKAEEWSEAIEVPFTVKVSTKQPTIKLDKKQLQLNRNSAVAAYEQAVTTVSWKDAAEGMQFESIYVSGANKAAEDVLSVKGLGFTINGTNVIAKIKDVTKLQKGTYKFQVHVKVNGDYTVSTPLSIKIVDVEASKTVKVTTKGTLDVLDRNTSISCTLALKSVNGTLKDVSLAGSAAHLFEAYMSGNGKISIYAKSSVALITKYKYSVHLKLTMENVEGESFTIVTAPITLKLKQSKPTVQLAPTEGIIYSSAGNSIYLQVDATLKNGAWLVVDNVQLASNQKYFEMNYVGGWVTLKATKEAVKGKTYTLQFKVYLANAADNEKPITVKYKVKVK